MDPITELQRIIGVYNHLLNKVFRFHYHHQKVIGSLGMVGIWFCSGGGQFGEVMLRKRRSDGKRGNCQWWIPFLEIFTVQWKITRSLPKNNLGDTPILHRSMIAGGRVANTTCLLFLWFVHQFQLFSRTRMGRSTSCFYTHPSDAFSADKTIWGALISSEGNNTMDQVNQM